MLTCLGLRLAPGDFSTVGLALSTEDLAGSAFFAKRRDDSTSVTEEKDDLDEDLLESARFTTRVICQQCSWDAWLRPHSKGIKNKSCHIQNDTNTTINKINNNYNNQIT